MNFPASSRGIAPIVTLIIVGLILTGLVVGVFLVQQNTNLIPKAQVNNQDQGACQQPAAVSNVKVDYPYCQ
jgi:hypothetical protein